jgi:hypothetical protein
MVVRRLLNLPHVLMCSASEAPFHGDMLVAESANPGVGRGHASPWSQPQAEHDLQPLQPGVGGRRSRSTRSSIMNSTRTRSFPTTSTRYGP